MLGSLAGKEGSTPEDDKMMEMLKGMLGSLGEEGNAEQGDQLFKQFSSFLQATEGDESMKGVLDSVVKDIISKDSLYTPMKTLKDEFPIWLENNWEKCSQEDLERYNKQLDKVTEICDLFDKDGEVNSDSIFEKLNQLQEFGQPPQELMTKVQQAGGKLGDL